jgi:hypothetical protein
VAGLTALTVLAALALVACGDGAGVPQPIPIPGQLRSMSAPLTTPTEIDVVGLPGAVAGAGQVLVTDVGGGVTKASSTAAGSFTLSLKARGGDVLQVRYEDSDAAALTVPKQGIMAPLPPGPITGVPPVTALSGGRVRVRGLSNGAGTQIVAVNATSGDAATAKAAGDKRFSLELTAAKGDALRVYEEVSGALGTAWSLTVP